MKLSLSLLATLCSLDKADSMGDNNLGGADINGCGGGMGTDWCPEKQECISSWMETCPIEDGETFVGGTELVCVNGRCSSDEKCVWTAGSAEFGTYYFPDLTEAFEVPSGCTLKCTGCKTYPDETTPDEPTLDADKTMMTSWKGELPYNQYGSGDECTESNILANAATTELIGMGNGALCETDEAGEYTVFSKFVIDQCGSEEMPNAFFLSAYNCDSSTCANCSDVKEFYGYGPKEYFDPTSLFTEVDHCFGWITTTQDVTSEASSLLADWNKVGEKSYQSFIPPSTLADSAAYWKVFLLNTCIAEFVGYEATDEVAITVGGDDRGDNSLGDGEATTKGNDGSGSMKHSNAKFLATIIIFLASAGWMVV